jgi:hypothetical protein
MQFQQRTDLQKSVEFQEHVPVFNMEEGMKNGVFWDVTP